MKVFYIGLVVLAMSTIALALFTPTIFVPFAADAPPAKTDTKAPAKVSDEQRLNDLSLQKLFIEKEYRIKELEAEQLKQSYTKMMLEYEPLKTKADAAAKVKADAAKKK